MACNDVRSLISAVLDRRVSAEDRALVAQHIAECVACRAEVRELEAVDAALKALPAPQPPEGYHESFVSRLTMKIDEQDQDEAKEKKPPKEDSGLIEIRKRASRDISAQEAARKRDVDDAVAAVSAVDIPAAVSQPRVVVPPRTEQPRRGWVVPVVAVGGLVVVAGVVFAMMQGGKREIVRAADPGAAPPPVPAAFDLGAPGAASAPAASRPTVAAAGPAVAMAPNEATPAKPAAVDPADKEKRSKAAKAEGHEPAAKREPKEPKEPKAAKEAKPAAAKDLVAVPAAKPEPAARPGSKADQLDELLRSGASAKKEDKKAEPGEELPETLNPDQIKSGMSSVRGRVMGCYDKYDVAGVARVSVTIGKNGKIASVSVTGEFSGTPTGECVSAAVKTASFPRFKGKPISIGYTYLLKR
ncbi:MAG: zf-HC2 domain-containing protein [Deltaproteobacteria bacterium]|nr:zf-HC2 domain-containing protein [Deltaproteobacteria bacterium]